MKERSLEEILKRNDYVKLVPVLRERAKKIVSLIKSKMEDLDLDVVTIKVNGEYYDFLNTYIKPEVCAIKKYFCIRHKKLIHVLEENVVPYYENMDGANNKTFLFLLNHAKEIIKVLELKENGLVSSVQNALKETDSLL